MATEIINAWVVGVHQLPETCPLSIRNGALEGDVILIQEEGDWEVWTLKDFNNTFEWMT